MKLLQAKWAEGKFVGVGLDTELGKLPDSITRTHLRSEAVFEFNKAIVAATADKVCAFKPNIAFYETQGEEGIASLIRTCVMIREIAPDVPIILDAKRADIGNTCEAYVKACYDVDGADAATVNPYLGEEALRPFLDRADKGVIVLCRTSNKGAGEFQDLPVVYSRIRGTDKPLTMPLYLYVAQQVAKKWNVSGNCCLVVGATAPKELGDVRRLVGDIPLLIPGIGAQGGDLEETVMFGADSKGRGMIINSSRGVIYASKEADFAQAARREVEKLHNQIRETLFRTGKSG